MTVSRGDDSTDSAAALCDSTKSAFRCLPNRYRPIDRVNRQLLEECPDALSVMARKFQFAIHGETQFFQVGPLVLLAAEPNNCCRTLEASRVKSTPKPLKLCSAKLGEWRQT